MSEKHTPGPWELDDLGNVCSQAVHNIALVFSSSTREGWSGSDFDTQAHCAANARLIAAAPELLEALDGMLQVYGGGKERDGLPKHSTELELIAQARAAIAKATGGAA